MEVFSYTSQRHDTGLPVWAPIDALTLRSTGPPCCWPPELSGEKVRVLVVIRDLLNTSRPIYHCVDLPMPEVLCGDSDAGSPQQ